MMDRPSLPIILFAIEKTTSKRSSSGANINVYKPEKTDNQSKTFQNTYFEIY